MPSPYPKRPAARKAPDRPKSGMAASAWKKAAAWTRRTRVRTADWLEGLPVVGPAVKALRIITVFGWMVLLLAVGSWYVGLRWQWLEVTGLAILLTFVWIVAIIWTIGMVRYVVKLKLAGQRVVVEESAVGELSVVNTSNRPCASSVIEVPVGAALAQFAVPILTGRSEFTEIFTVPTRRRGIITIGPVRSVRGDGLGLLRREQNWVEAQELYVHPRTVNVASNAIGFIRDIEGATTHDLSSSDVAFHALREYLPGDDRRNVHWRTTARTGRLMVRQFEESRRAHLLIVFDDDARSWHNYREYELGVSVAASIGAAVIRERRDLSFTSQLGPVPTSSPNAFLDGLTKIEPKAGVERLGDLARIATDREPQASVVAVVTGSRPEASELHRAHAALPVNARSFALRIHEAERVSRALVGGFPIVTIPSLDSLPLALRKAVS